MLRRSQRCFTMGKYTQKDKLTNVCRDSCVKKKTVCECVCARVCVEGWTFFIKTYIVTFDRKSFWSDSWLPMTQKKQFTDALFCSRERSAANRVSPFSPANGTCTHQKQRCQLVSPTRSGTTFPFGKRFWNQEFVLRNRKVRPPTSDWLQIIPLLQNNAVWDFVDVTGSLKSFTHPNAVKKFLRPDSSTFMQMSQHTLGILLNVIQKLFLCSGIVLTNEEHFCFSLEIIFVVRHIFDLVHLQGFQTRSYAPHEDIRCFSFQFVWYFWVLVHGRFPLDGILDLCETQGCWRGSTRAAIHIWAKF